MGIAEADLDARPRERGAPPAPPAPARWRRVLGPIGRVLLVAGALILLFVAFQLWGTGVATRQAQDRLRHQFEAPRETPPAPNRPSPAGDDPVPAAPPVIPAAPAIGGLAGRIQIPAIGVDFMFLEGVDLTTLQDGPGHYPGTPLPGYGGNAAIAGHRTTYLHPFYDLDKLGTGDEILISYVGGAQFTYQYRSTEIVDPSQVEVLHDKGDDRLTLTACNPKYSARERIVVTARLVDPPIAPTPASTAAPGSPQEQTPEVALGAGLDGPRGPIAPALLWGFAAVMVWVAAYLVGRAWRRWPTYLLALPVFLLVLFQFFVRFSQLLPASF